MPYSRIRHPIYTGILLAIAGTVLAIGRYRALLALLSTEFGPAFDEHKRLTGFYLPR